MALVESVDALETRHQRVGVVLVRVFSLPSQHQGVKTYFPEEGKREGGGSEGKERERKKK